MQKNSNRRGLALGAIFALVASLFATAPASANMVDGANIGVYPVAENGTTTSAFVGTLVDDFPIYVQARPGNAALTSGETVIFRVQKTAGTNMDVVVSASATATNMNTVTSLSPASQPVANVPGMGYMQAGSTSITVSAVVGPNGIAHLNFKASSASGLASWSAVSLLVTVFQDNQGGVSNDIINTDEWRTTQTVSLLHPTALTRTLTATALAVGTNGVTLSSTVTGVNLANISGRFAMVQSVSGTAALVGSNVTAAEAFARGGVVSSSGSITAITGTERYEFSLRYHTGEITAATDGSRVGAILVSTAARGTATALVVEVAEGANAVSTSGDTGSGLVYAVRPNQTYTITITALSNSSTVAGEVVTVALVGPSGLDVAAGKAFSIDGGAMTSSYPTALSLTTGANGRVSFTLASSGVAEADTSFTATVRSAVSNISKTVVLDPETPGFKAAAEFTNYATAPGTALNINFDVKDRWGVASSRVDQRLKVDVSSTGFQGNPTLSFVAVVAGKATFAFTGNPATKTGSATVLATVQTLNQDNGVWTDLGSSAGSAAVNVTDVANTFTGSALASASASISYAVATGLYSWSAATVTVRSLNAGADVVVSAPGAFIQNQADSKTFSATATLRTNGSGLLNLKFASTKAGTHTISYTVGGVTTTSQLIITAAQVQNASKITLAAADMTAGQTTTITGVVADAFDNPVEYTGADKKLIVGWTGKGLPFNIGTAVNTDEDGKFTFQVLVLAGETGTGVATVTFKPTDVAAGNVTVTRTYTIAAPAAVVAPEVSAVIGSFNGRWAVRVENAKGAVVSVKVGNRWVKYTSLNDNYLFSRKSRVGATVPVAVYVNGQLENVATITIK